MEVPRLEKIVINMVSARPPSSFTDRRRVKDLEVITGQKPVITRAAPRSPLPSCVRDAHRAKVNCVRPGLISSTG